MSLATRCTSCKTVFRVVQDQLKVSEGWVRCGRCGTVFNALEALFDLEKDTPARWQTSQNGGLDGKKRAKSRRTDHVHGASSGSGGSGRTSRKSDDPVHYRRRSDAAASAPARTPVPPAPPTRPPAPQPTPSASLPAEAKPSHGHSDFADAQFDPDMAAHVQVSGLEITEPLPLAPSAPVAAESPARRDALVAGTEETPRPDMGEGYEPATLEFVRLAERQAKWQHPRMRLILGSVSAGLALILALQMLHHFRDITAARWPGMAPVLVRWCQTFQCQLQAPRRIDNVVVESINLTRNASNADTFLLSVALRNKGNFAVLLPALDLSLRDLNGQLITRRMLRPEDLHSKTNVIEADSETQMQVILKEKEQRIVGYTVEAFYP